MSTRIPSAFLSRARNLRDGPPPWSLSAKGLRAARFLRTRKSFGPPIPAKLVLISDLGSGDVVILDAPGRKIIKSVNVGKNAEGILIQPDGSRAFIAAASDDKVVILDLKSLNIAGEIHTGKGPDGMAWVQ